MIKNLVFKGGGVLGIAYAGAIQVLEEKKILDQIEKVAGTSAGAITALLLSLKYSASEILQIVNSTDFSSFEDSLNIIRPVTKYGIYKGNAFLSWIIKYVVSKGLNPTSTFRDFRNAGFLDLHVFATDLNIGDLKRFSFDDTPNVVVVEAVRASMSIPLFFQAWKFTDNNPDNHIYVDGGLVYNYPLSAFDIGDEDNKETIGLFLSDLSRSKVVTNLDYYQAVDYLKAVVGTLLDSQNVNFESDGEELSRSIIIDSLGVSSTNFKISDDQKKKLYESGQKYTTEYLSKLI
jgi:NTE family protein